MTIQAVDLFCGAGGTSSGILEACDEDLRQAVNLTAVNHWPTAINTHTLNHPRVHHICEPVENLWPARVVKGRLLHLLAASCECTFHSNARGGGPCNEQSRSQPWQLVRWASDLRVENILMENVREFKGWGPLHQRTKRPIKSRKGEYFNAFLNALRNLGYQVEWKIQVAADFGDPTSRPRLMLMARLGKKVVWPAASHGPGLSPWRTAREIIDWSLVGTSIFNRKRPLCQNTLNRIAAGLKKFGGPAAGPFIIHLTHHGEHGRRCHSLNSPLPSVTGSKEMALVEPIIIQTDQTGGNGIYARSVDQPIGTVVSKQNMLLVEPLILKYYRTGRCCPVDEPLDTITTKARFMLVECKSGRRVAELDIRTRMLQPHELAAAHSFPASYQFTGTKESQTKQIGNSVPVKLARAHALAILS